jgi:hypothetical protein
LDGVADGFEDGNVTEARKKRKPHTTHTHERNSAQGENDSDVSTRAEERRS